MATKRHTIRFVPRRIHSLMRKPRFVLLWLLPTWVMLGISRLIILTATFRRIAPYLGRPVGLNAYTHLLSPHQKKRALQISQVIRLSSRFCPWVANCFPQAVTARMLLGLYRIPYSLYFGVARDGDTREFKAHAWVAAGRIPVSGGQSFGSFTIVGCYTSSIV